MLGYFEDFFSQSQCLSVFFRALSDSLSFLYISVCFFLSHTYILCFFTFSTFFSFWPLAFLLTFSLLTFPFYFAYIILYFTLSVFLSFHCRELGIEFVRKKVLEEQCCDYGRIRIFLALGSGSVLF